MWRHEVDLMTYLDARLFLSDIYKYRKTHEPRFSYERWAEKLGITSKSYLRFVALGKRKISNELIAKLCHELLIRNYLSFEDVSRDIKSIAATFAVSPEKVAAALCSLQEAQLIEFTPSGWKARHDWVKIQDHFKDDVLTAYHNRSLQKAMECQTLASDLRSYRSLSFALSQDDYRRLLENVNQWVRDLSSAYDSAQLASKRIYQLNLNVIPWTVAASVAPAAAVTPETPSPVRVPQEL